jgi:hypothetical protein
MLGAVRIKSPTYADDKSGPAVCDEICRQNRNDVELEVQRERDRK